MSPAYWMVIEAFGVLVMVIGVLSFFLGMNSEQERHEAAEVEVITALARETEAHTHTHQCLNGVVAKQKFIEFQRDQLSKSRDEIIGEFLALKNDYARLQWRCTQLQNLIDLQAAAFKAVKTGRAQ